MQKLEKQRFPKTVQGIKVNPQLSSLKLQIKNTVKNLTLGVVENVQLVGWCVESKSQHIKLYY